MLVKMRERNEGRKDSIHHEGHEGHEVSKSGKGTGYFFSNSTKKNSQSSAVFSFLRPLRNSSSFAGVHPEFVDSAQGKLCRSAPGKLFG